MAVVNTRPSATTGEAMLSSKLADQRTFSVLENFVGNGNDEVETPLALGPRNCGQSSLQAVRVEVAKKLVAAHIISV